MSAGLRTSAVLVSMALTVIVMTEVIGHSAERARIRRLRQRVREGRLAGHPPGSTASYLP